MCARFVLYKLFRKQPFVLVIAASTYVKRVPTYVNRNLSANCCFFTPFYLKTFGFQLVTERLYRACLLIRSIGANLVWSFVFSEQSEHCF